MRGTSVRAGCRVAVVVLLTGLAAGCALGKGATAPGDTKAPPDSPAALRQDVDRLRADLVELRTRVESAQRAGSEHADRVAVETRAEFDAVRKAIEASSRNELQRQVEVLDAQSRRIDLLEKRVADLGQTLRRIELTLGGLESQLGRVLDSTPPPRGSRAGPASRSPDAVPAPRAADESAPAAAGAGLTPPAMLGTGPPAARPAPDDPTRVAKVAPRPAETKASVPERPLATAPPPAKTGAPAAPSATGSLTARALFDRGMESWQKGEQGQAVLDFEELVQKFPSDPLAASAQFRIGEAYYTARDFERAALEYRKAVDLAPKGKDAPQALLRLGLAYRAQKRESDARQAWNQLVRDFPESDASEEARRALSGR